MTVKQIADNFENSLVDIPQPAALAANKSIEVTAFTVANNSKINASYKAYIKSDVGTLTPIRPLKVVVWGEIDLGSGITGQVIPAGGQLLVESSALNSLYFTVSGNEVIN